MLGAALPADSASEAAYPLPLEKVQQVLAMAEEPPLVFVGYEDEGG